MPGTHLIRVLTRLRQADRAFDEALACLVVGIDNANVGLGLKWPLAVIRERVSLAVEQTWIEPVRSARSGADGVRPVLATIAHTLDERGSVLGCPLSNLALELSLADPDFRSDIQGIFDGWQRAIADKFRADRKSGDLRHGDPDELATFVVASYSGAMAIAKARQDSLPLKSCAKQLAALLEDHRNRQPSKIK